MIAKLKEEIGHLQHEIIERDDRIRYLTEEVESEKRHRLEAQECARSDPLVVENLKLDLVEERSAHQMSQATVQALEARFAFLESETHKVEVIEEYCHGPVGKVEVSFVCKVGFNYLLAWLPPESRPTPDSLYPSRVANYLDFLRDFKVKGGGVLLEVVDGDDEDDLGDDQEEVTPPAAQPTIAPESSAALPSPTPDPSRDE